MIILVRPNGTKNVYIELKYKGKTNAETRHILQRKAVIYGYDLFSTYNPEMDFNNALNAGYIIELDNRHNYGKSSV